MEEAVVSVRKWKNGWQVRVRPFSEVTLPTKSAAETIDLDLRLRKKLGHLYIEKPRTFGEELAATLERKRAMGGLMTGAIGSLLGPNATDVDES